MNHKIALLTDSCSDVPKDYVEKYGMFVVPLTIHYSYGHFRDGVDITAQEVYDRFEQEVPKTSLPSGETIAQTLQSICDKGYDQVVIVTISSGLSGTHNMLAVMAKEFPQLDCRIIDTKNIGIASGLTAIRAGRLIEEGLTLDEIETTLLKAVENTRIYFCVATLEYLKKGGRIGLVSATMGSLLGILPVISCNEEGVYYTAKKARGRKAVLDSAISLTYDFLSQSEKYIIAVVHGGAEQEAEQVGEKVKALLPNYTDYITGQISPALVVHTGPGLIGLCIQRL